MSKTRSEHLVERTNKFYLINGLAKITKKDPKVSKINNKYIYTTSRGLDYEGVLQNGQHIEFEVKETEKNYLPITNIRITQLDFMRDLDIFGANTFLLIYYSVLDEWYRLNPKEVFDIIEYKQIPVEYARAYGMMIEKMDNNSPDFLNPMPHPARNIILDNKELWFPKKSEDKQLTAKIERKRSRQEIMESVRKNLLRGIENSKKKRMF